MNFQTELTPVVEVTMALIQRKLRESQQAQGHDNTGRLRESIQYDVIADTNTIVGRMYFEDYGIYVNVGVRAASVRYPITVMIEWFRSKGLNEREATRAAWATRAVHQREGIPTRASARFSQTGQRTGFVEKALEDSLDDIGAIIEQRLGAWIELQFQELFQTDNIKVFA